MKSFLVVIFALLLFHNGWSQKTDSASLAKLSASDLDQYNLHMQTMKKSKTTAWLLLAGGAVAEGVAVGMFVNADNDTQKGAAALVAFLGAGAIAGSFPFFIKAKKHKMMANALLYGEKPVSIAPGVVLPLTQSYGIRFTIPLAK